MKNLYNKLSLFSVLALVAFEPQNLQATSNNPSAEEIQDSQKTQIFPSFKSVYDTVQNSALALATFRPQTLWATSNNPIQDIVQNIQKGQFMGDLFLKDRFKNSKEIKNFESKMAPNDPLFDSWITLILKTFPTDPAFKEPLKRAITRG